MVDEKARAAREAIRAEFLVPEIVRERFHYDPETGSLVWASGPRKGQEAGSVNEGGRFIHIHGVTIRLSQVAWVYAHGRRPLGSIGFLDGCNTNLRLANLIDSAEAPAGHRLEIFWD